MRIIFQPQYRDDVYALARLVEYDGVISIAIDGENFPLALTDEAVDEPTVQQCKWVVSYDGENLSIILPYSGLDIDNREFTFPEPVDVAVWDIIPIPTRTVEPDPVAWPVEEED